MFNIITKTFIYRHVNKRNWMWGHKMSDNDISSKGVFQNRKNENFIKSKN